MSKCIFPKENSLIKVFETWDNLNNTYSVTLKEKHFEITIFTDKKYCFEKLIDCAYSFSLFNNNSIFKIKFFCHFEYIDKVIKVLNNAGFIKSK